MRVLHVFDHSLPHQSGYVYRSLALLQEQKRRGWQSFHVTSARQGSVSSPFHPQEEIEGWSFYRTPPHGRRLPIWREISDMSALSRTLSTAIEETHPDIIHVHSPVLNFFPAYRYAKRLSIPIVYEIRAFWEDAAVDHGHTHAGSIRYRASQYLETMACRMADHVFTICDGLRQDLIQRGIDPHKIDIVPNAVNVSDFPMVGYDLDLANTLELQGKTVLGFIGSLYAYEGLESLFQAMPTVLKHFPDVRLLIVGGGLMTEKLHDLRMNLGLDPYIKMVGRVPHAMVGHYYALCDAMIFPRHSIRLTELVTPLKPLESMALNKPVLLTDIGGHRELVRHGDTGYLLDGRDINTLAQSLQDALLARDSWGSMVVRAHNYVSTQRTWAHSVDVHEKIYTTLRGK